MPPIAKNVTKEYHSVVTHVFHHFYDMSLVTACFRPYRMSVQKMQFRCTPRGTT